MSYEDRRFTGMVPKAHPTQLPAGAAQVCHNFDPQSGALVPTRVPTAALKRAVDADGYLISHVPADELIYIPKPAAPTIASRQRYCHPEEWLTATLLTFVEYLDSNGARITATAHALPLTMNWEPVHAGGNLYCRTSAMAPVTFGNGGPYFFRGPRFSFHFQADPGLNGGPSVGVNIPDYVQPTSPVFSANTVPLFSLDNNMYGEWQIIDYAGPIWDEEIVVVDWDYYTYYFRPFSCSFRINLNFARNKQTHYYYVSSHVKRSTKNGIEVKQEGPPSKKSQRFTLRPGEYFKLNCPKTEGYELSLYRSTTGNDDFLRVRENVASVFQDLPHPATADEFPPFGNWPQILGKSGAGTDADKALILRGAIVHPAGFVSVIYKDNLWNSDRYRWWVYPKENTQPGPSNFIAHVLSGDTIILFTEDGEVYGRSGGDPEHGAFWQISNTHPLLNIKGLINDGQTWYWPTTDGLARCTGGRIDIVTEPFFTSEAWQALNPASMLASIADRVIYLEASFTPVVPTIPVNLWAAQTPVHMQRYQLGNTADNNGVIVRFDLKEQIGAVTTLKSLTEVGPGTFKGRVVEYPFNVTFDHIRYGAAGPVTCIAHVDGVDQAPVVAENGNTKRVQWPHGRYWCWTHKGEHTISSFEAMDRAVRAGEDVMTWRPEDAPSLHNLRFGFPQPEGMAVLLVRCQSQAPVPVRLLGDAAEDVVFETQILDGKAVALPVTARTRHAVYRLEVTTEVRVDEVVAAREVTLRVDGDMIAEAHTGLIAPWLLRHYEFAQPVNLRSLRVAATEPVFARFFYDGVDAWEGWSAPDPWEQRLQSEAPFRRLRVAFVDDAGAPADHLVMGFTLTVVEPLELGLEGYHVAELPAARRIVVRFPERANYSAVSVVAETYPVYLDLYRYGEDEPEHTEIVTGPHTHALPWDGMLESHLWEFDMRTSETALLTRIRGFHLYPKRGVAFAGPHLAVANPGGAAPWLVARYEAGQEMFWPSVIVETVDAMPVWMKLWIDGQPLEELIECRNGIERYLIDAATMHTGRTLEFRFYTSEGGRKQKSADSNVLHVTVFGSRPEAVNDVLVLEAPPYLSRELQLPHAGRFTACQLVMRDGYEATPVTLALRSAEGFTIVTPLHDRVFALPVTPLSARWRVSVEVPAEGEDGEIAVGADAAIVSIALFVEQTVPVRAVDARAIPGPPEWLRSRYEYPEPTPMGALRAECEAYPLSIVANIDGVDQAAISVVSDVWKSEVWTSSGRIWTFRTFDSEGRPADHLVRTLQVIPLQELTVPPDGVFPLPDLPTYAGIRLRFATTGAWAGVSVDADCATTVTLTPVPLPGGDGSLVAAVPANDPALRRLPATGQTVDQAIIDPLYAAVWHLDIAYTGRIRSVVLLPWQDVPGQAVIELGPDRSFPEWYRTRLTYPQTRVLRSARFLDELSCAFYFDGAKRVLAEDAHIEHRFDTKYAGKELVVDFGIGRIQGAIFAMEEDVPVDAAGFAIRNAQARPLWRNKVLRFKTPGAPSVISAKNAGTVRIKKYDSGPWTTLNLNAPDYTEVVQNLSAALAWELDVEEYAGELHELFVFTHVPAFLKDGLVVIRRDGDPFTWLDKRVMCARPTAFSWLRVIASTSVTVTARDIERSTVLWSRTVSNSKAVRLPKEYARKDFTLDSVRNSDGGEIDEVALATNSDALRMV